MNKRIKKKNGKISIATAKDIYSLIDDHFLKSELAIEKHLPSSCAIPLIKVIHRRILEKISKGFLEDN